MRGVGLGLLVAGWFIAVAAVTLLGAGAARGAFVLAGTGVEALGLVFFARSHLPSKETDE